VPKELEKSSRASAVRASAHESQSVLLPISRRPTGRFGGI